MIRVEDMMEVSGVCPFDKALSFVVLRDPPVCKNATELPGELHLRWVEEEESLKEPNHSHSFCQGEDVFPFGGLSYNGGDCN
jgi:hypothetical protein